MKGWRRKPKIHHTGTSGWELAVLAKMPMEFELTGPGISRATAWRVIHKYEGSNKSRGGRPGPGTEAGYLTATRRPVYESNSKEHVSI